MSVVPVTVVVLIAGDLMISNRWMLHPVSAPGIAEPSLIAQKIQNDRAAADLDPRELLSIDRSDGRVDFDPLWLETSSPDRIAEIARWRRESLFPKTHLDISNVQVHGSFCSIMPAAMNRSASSNDEADLLEIARTADGYVTATGSGPVLAWNEGALPMAWIENASASSDSYDRDTVFCNCLWSDGKFEIHLPETSVKEKAASDLRLVVRLLTTDGWSANLLDDHGQVQSSLELMRIDDFHACVSVPQIHRRVQLIYRPVSFRVGLGISAVSIVAILGFLLLDFRAPKLPKASKAR
jgi:hypothetical protein